MAHALPGDFACMRDRIAPLEAGSLEGGVLTPGAYSFYVQLCDVLILLRQLPPLTALAHHGGWRESEVAHLLDMLYAARLIAPRQAAMFYPDIYILMRDKPLFRHCLWVSSASVLLSPWLPLRPYSIHGQDIATLEESEYSGYGAPERDDSAVLRWREYILSRDGRQCQRCSTPDVSILDVHHIRSWATYPQSRTNPANGVTLCRPCHRWVHSNDNSTTDVLRA